MGVEKCTPYLLWGMSSASQQQSEMLLAEENGKVAKQGDEQHKYQGLGGSIEDAAMQLEIPLPQKVDRTDAHPVKTQDDNGALG